MYLIFKYCRLRRVAFHSGPHREPDESELELLVKKEQKYSYRNNPPGNSTSNGDCGDVRNLAKEENLPKYGIDRWEATLSCSKYFGVSICVADPYSDEAREITCVVDPAVSWKDVARFLLMADKAKMNRTSAKARDLTFLGPNREVQHSANWPIPVAVRNAVMPGMRVVCCTFIPLAIFAILLFLY